MIDTDVVAAGLPVRTNDVCVAGPSERTGFAGGCVSGVPPDGGGGGDEGSQARVRTGYQIASAVRLVAGRVLGHQRERVVGAAGESRVRVAELFRLCDLELARGLIGGPR